MILSLSYKDLKMIEEAVNLKIKQLKSEEEELDCGTTLHYMDGSSWSKNKEQLHEYTTLKNLIEHCVNKIARKGEKLC